MTTVKNICTANVQHVSPDTPVTDVAKRMKDHDCGSVLISQDDRLIGVITDRDITLRCVAESMDPVAMTAEQCMSPDILYCYADDTAEDALNNMADNAIKRLPVLNNREEKRLVGIVSFGDLSAACEEKDVSGRAMEDIRVAA